MLVLGRVSSWDEMGMCRDNVKKLELSRTRTQPRTRSPILSSLYQVLVYRYIFDIGQLCYGQLRPVKTRYPLTSNT